jgi:poly(A) polymerase
VKFAARCNLNIEPETYRRMLDHAEEIQKCAQARVSEEIYRLLRAGAAKRSMELLLETTLLRQLIPSIDAALEAPESDLEAQMTKRRFWGYLAALDRSTQRRDAPPSNALILATLLFARLRDALHPDSNGINNIGQHVTQAIAASVEQIKASRRDSDLAYRILLAMRYMFDRNGSGRRRLRLNGREFEADAHRLHEIVADAETLDPEIVGRPLLAEGETPTLSPEAEERLARELETPSEFERRRGGGGGAREGGAREGGPARGREGQPARTRGDLESNGPAPRGIRTPIPDMGGLRNPDDPRMAFLGTGGFGGRWSVQES